MRDLLAKMAQLEEALQRSDVKRIFSTAADLRKPSFFKKDINVDDLLQVWRDNEFPSSTKAIVAILQSANFSHREINKVFKNAGYGSSEQPTVSPAMNKLSKYIIDNGYSEEILQFLKSKYTNIDESHVADKDMVIEDIRTVFDAMSKEARPDLEQHIRQYQCNNLGRHKK